MQMDLIANKYKIFINYPYGGEVLLILSYK